jgi:hypothetical protein
VAWLAERTGIPLEAMLGGRLGRGLDFLQRVGHSAPSNANASIRDVDYTAPHPTAGGVRDILAHYGLLS